MNTANTASTYCILLEKPDLQGPTFFARPKRNLDIGSIKRRPDVELTRRNIAEILEELGDDKRREVHGENAGEHAM